VLSSREIEIKLRVGDAQAARSLLRTAGFSVCRRRVFEDNVILDTPDLQLRGRGALFRVRAAGGTSTLTFKGPAAIGSRHKSQEELEIEISDCRKAEAILKNLGFHRAFRYQKYRTEYSEPGVRIDRTARRLGFSEKDYITLSYGALYFQLCASQGIKPADMVFPRRAT